MRKRILVLMLLLTFTISSCCVVYGAPYDTYNYTKKLTSVPVPHSYLPSKIINGKDLGVGDLNNPEDIFIGKSKNIYIVDTGNNRIVCLDRNWKLIRIIDSFTKKTDGGSKIEKFNSPKGLFETDAGNLYIADTNNHRVIELDGEGNFIREIGPPKSEVLRKDFNYLPSKLVIDKADRMYVIGPEIFEGIVEFDAEGNFTQFTGSNKVKPNLYEYFWTRVMATKEQRKQSMRFIPEEFSNIDIDEQGFLYTSSIKSFLKRLNNQGEDITKKITNLEPKGDYTFTAEWVVGGGQSKFVDVCVDEYNIYSGLDAARGRVFTYDSEGNLLSVFGRLGDQEGTFKNPVAIETLNDNLIILDREYSRLTVFSLTEYGKLVRQAVILHYNGDYSMASVMWEKVLRMNSNSDLAYLGIGKALLSQNKSKEAMKFFQLSGNKDFYSKAYKRHRREVIREYMGPVLTGLILLLLVILIIRKIRLRRAAGRKGGYKAYVSR